MDVQVATFFGIPVPDTCQTTLGDAMSDAFMNVRGAIRDFEDQLKARLDVLFERVARAVPSPVSSPSVSLRRTTTKSYASTRRISKPSEIASTTRMRKFTPLR